jgi:hypothetical protein
MLCERSTRGIFRSMALGMLWLHQKTMKIHFCEATRDGSLGPNFRVEHAKAPLQALGPNNIVEVLLSDRSRSTTMYRSSLQRDKWRDNHRPDCLKAKDGALQRLALRAVEYVACGLSKCNTSSTKLVLSSPPTRSLPLSNGAQFWSVAER